MYGVFNTSLQGLWLHLATTKIFAWPHATLVFAGTPKDMLPQTQSARERRTLLSAEYTDVMTALPAPYCFPFSLFYVFHSRALSHALARASPY